MRITPQTILLLSNQISVYLNVTCKLNVTTNKFNENKTHFYYKCGYPTSFDF